MTGDLQLDRNYAIDYIKFFAIISIVSIHTSPFSGANLFGIEGALIDDFIINVLARFGVPFFFVASGYLFAKKMTSTSSSSHYFKKYITKLIKLFVSWYLFFVMFGLVINVGFAILEKSSLKTVIVDYFSGFLSFKVILYGDGGYGSHHLWYLVALIWSILIIFFFFKWDKIRILLITALVLNIVGLLGQTYIGIYDLGIQTRDTFFFGLFYTTLGFYLAKHEQTILNKSKKLSSKLLLSLFIFFSLMQMAERYLAEVYWGELVVNTDYYLFTIFSTVCLFLFVMKNNDLGKGSRLSKIGSNAVGIYVTHTIFISFILLSFRAINIDITANVIFHFIFTPLILIVSYYYYYLLQKLKSNLSANKDQTAK